MSDPDSTLFIPLQKNAMDIWRFAACREYTAASFRYQFQTQLIEEVYEIGIRWSFLKPILLEQVIVPDHLKPKEEAS